MKQIIRPGDVVRYYRMGCQLMLADVLRISPKGLLSLNVHQGGAVPYYTATGVKPTSVVLVQQGSPSEATESTVNEREST